MSSTQFSKLSERTVIGLFGAGGFARELMPVVLAQAQAMRRATPGRKFEVCFVQTQPEDEHVNGIPVMAESDFLALGADQAVFNVGIGDSQVRERIATLCLAHGIAPISLVAHNVVSFETSQVGQGAVLCAFSMITANARIGRFFHSNIYSYVAHDCVVGDFVTFAPRVHCNGNVHIHDHAYIGTGAILRQGTPDQPLVIGEGAVVGMGAVVTKDVAPHTTVVGNPARPMAGR